MPHEPRPVLAAARAAKIAIIGQAPGARVHATGKTWDDASGKQLRRWLGVNEETFYDERHFAMLPLGFCYPGKGKSGDLPPRPECAPLWHGQLLDLLPNIRLKLLIGTYAQDYYLKDSTATTLTERVQTFENFLPHQFPLPHPSPRNGFWIRRNPWFEKSVLPKLRKSVRDILSPH